MNEFKGSSKYVVSEDLLRIVNISIALQKPLPKSLDIPSAQEVAHFSIQLGHQLIDLIGRQQFQLRLKALLLRFLRPDRLRLRQ